MIVALFDLRVDAAHVDLRSDRRPLRMFPIDLDPAVEARELSASRTKELMHTEPNGGAGRIEPIALLCQRGGSQTSDCNRSHEAAQNPFDKIDCHVERSELLWLLRIESAAEE